MANVYLDLKARQQKEVNDFPMVFAFSKQQFAEGMKQLGLTPGDTDKVLSLGSTGGFLLKTDEAKLDEMLERHVREMQEAVDGDPTGEGFIFQMFDYELGNHEYSYTWDLEPTLSALDLTIEEVEKDPKLKRGLDKARKAQSA